MQLCDTFTTNDANLLGMRLADKKYSQKFCKVKRSECTNKSSISSACISYEFWGGGLRTMYLPLDL